MFSTLPLVLIIVVAATIVITRSGRDQEAPSSTTPEPPLPAPPSGVDLSVLRPLAGREALRLTRHPAVVVGYLLTSIAIVILNEGGSRVLHREAVVVALAAFPLAGLTLVATNLATLRSTRFAAQGIVDTTPASPSTRTAALLLASLAPAFVFTALLAAWNVGLAVTGAAGVRPSVAELAHGPALVVCGGLCGVFLATWVRTPVVAVPSVIALGAVEYLFEAPTPSYRPIRQLGWAVVHPTEIPLELLDRRPQAHLAYIAALACLVVAAAMARFIRIQASVAALVCTAVLVVAAGVAVTRPLDTDRAARAAAWVNDATDLQRCHDVSGARLCAYPEYDFRDRWQPIVERVVAAAPPGRRPVLVTQRVPPRALVHVHPAIVARFAEGAPRSPEDRWPDNGAVHTEVRWHDGGWTDHLLAIDVASALVGLPVGQSPAGVVCSAADQARAVVALWLAAHGSDLARKRITDAATADGLDGIDPDDPRSASIVVFPVFDVEQWVYSYEPPVRWSVRDVRYAAAMLRLPDSEVAATLSDHWTELVDQNTTSDQLAERVALDRQPPLDDLAREVGTTAADAERMAATVIEGGLYFDVPAMRGRCP